MFASIRKYYIIFGQKSFLRNLEVIVGVLPNYRMNRSNKQNKYIIVIASHSIVEDHRKTQKLKRLGNGYT